MKIDVSIFTEGFLGVIGIVTYVWKHVRPFYWNMNLT